MKIKLKAILILSVLFFQVSCTKWMDIQPEQGLIKQEFWKTKEDVKTVLMGAYNAFRGMDGSLFKYGEIRADMVTGGIYLGGDDQKIMDGIYIPGQFPVQLVRIL